MMSTERDRFLVSLLSAFVIHAFIVLLLGFVDLDKSERMFQSTPPLSLSLDLPETPVYESSPEDTAPAADDTDASPAEVNVEEQAELEQEAPAAATESVAVERSPRSTVTEQSPQQEYRIPQPSAEAERLAAEAESGPARNTRRQSAESEEPPVSRSREAEEYGEEVPEDQSQQSEGSRVVYEEGGRGSGAAEPSSAESDFATDTEGQSPALVSQDLLDKLENVEASPGPGEGHSQEQPTEQRTSESPSSDVEIALEQGHQNRELLDYALPELSSEELSKLPRT
ncbi:MAG TPA: hypothetical protein ENN41_01155, partial [Sediminispirochaeta sp.]|nr:hypothetical protein [Sediminispirochaeta sp.]